MKILWFSHRDIKHPLAGGAERTVYEIGKRLSARGHILDWVTVSWKGARKLESLSGIQIHRLDNNYIAHIVSPVIAWKIRPDVIIDDLGHVMPWFSEQLTRSPGTVLFYHLHKRSLSGQVTLPLRLLLTFIETSYHRIYKKWPFIVIGDSARADLESIGVARDRIRVIPLGVSSDWYLNSKKTKSPTLVYFGGIKNYKRPWEPIYLMQALNKIDEDLKLIMIGDGPALGAAKSLVKELGLCSQIHFTGRVNEKELHSLVSSSWINLHTSETEGFGLSILESSAAGTPTIAYNVSGVKDAIKDGINGFKVEDGNLKEFAAKVMWLIQNYNIKIIDSSIDFARDYSWDKSALLWESHLNGLI